MPKQHLPTVIAPLSAGAIVYTKKGDQTMILMLEQSNKFYYRRTGKSARNRVIDIGPCGRLEPGEDPIAAARREMKQETNLDIEIDRSFSSSVHYTFDGIAESGMYKGRKAHIRRTRLYFMAKASEKDLEKLRLSEEHIRFIWMPLDKAIKYKLLKSPQRAVLNKLQRRLSATN